MIPLVTDLNRSAAMTHQLNDTTPDFEVGDRVRSRKHSWKTGTVEHVFGGVSFPGLSYCKLDVLWDGDRCATTQFRDEITKID